MRKYCILLLTVTWAACSFTPKNNVELFNGLSLKLNAGESVKNINSLTQEIYFSLFDNKSFSIPLFKYAKGDNYSMFIGIPYNISIEKFIYSEIIAQDSLTTIADIKTDSATYGFRKSMSSNVYIAKYISKQAGNNLFIVATTPSSSIADSLFTYEKFKSRLQTK